MTVSVNERECEQDAGERSEGVSDCRNKVVFPLSHGDLCVAR